MSKLEKGKNDLATVRPELAEEWDWEKNILKPTDVTEFSDKQIYWRCKKYGHSWPAHVSWRSSGNGCPYCANKKLLKGFNDLATLFPEIAAEWDYEKNSKRPEEYIAGTPKRAYWKCRRCGHSWPAQIKERTYNNTGCPKCKFHHKTSMPEQAIYYYVKKCFPDAVNSYQPDFLTPREIDVYIPSLRLAIEYDGKAWHQNTERDLEKSRLLRENGIRLIRVRDRGSPSLGDDVVTVWCDSFDGEASSLQPMLESLFRSINTLFSLKAEPQIDPQRDILEIKSAYMGSVQERSLLAANPVFLQEWHKERNGNLTPDQIEPYSRLPVWWRCSSCGREWLASSQSRMQGGLYCEHCNKTKANRRRALERIRTGKSKALTEYPLLMREWDWEENAKNGLDPTELTYGSEKSAAWICEACGNHFPMYIKNRTIQGQGCPLCGRKKSAQTRSKAKKKAAD